VISAQCPENNPPINGKKAAVVSRNGAPIVQVHHSLIQTFAVAVLFLVGFYNKVVS